VKSLRENIKKLGDKLDKKALVMAVGLMIMSWTALIPVYFILLRRKKDKEKWDDIKVVKAKLQSLQEKGKVKEGNEKCGEN
jgi:hypothetical protein